MTGKKAGNDNKKGRNDAPFVTLTLNPSPPVILTLTLNEVKRKGKNLILLRTGSVKGKGLAVTEPATMPTVLFPALLLG